MKFEIDVSGDDLLNKNYTICVANHDGIVKGFKFSQELVKVLSSRYGQGFYKYIKSGKGKANFKVRLYCISIYYLFKTLSIRENISLTICRDFDGRENDIKENLKHLLIKKLKLDLKADDIQFDKLDESSNAHKYAYLMRKDCKNKMTTYVNITIKDFEKFLKK